MLNRLIRLCAVVSLLMPGLAMAGGEGDPNPGAKKAMAHPKAKAPKDCTPYEPAKKRVYGSHAHPLLGQYNPPESHEQVDLDNSPADVLNRNVRILRTTNKAQLNRYVPIVYNFKNVNPFAVLRFMRRPVQMEEGAIFTFVNPDTKSGKVLVAIPEYQVPYMQELFRTIDRPDLTTSDGTKRIYRQLKHRRANVDPENPLLDDNAFLQTFNIYLTDNESLVIADPTRNAVFIEDTPSGANYLDAAITDKLDVPTPQVILNTSVYEIQTGNNSRIGLDYIAWKNGPGASLWALGAFAEHGRVKVEKDLGSTGLPKSNFTAKGYNFAYQYDVPSQFFDFLAVRNKARVLNSARIAALNTRPALLSAGDQILYYKVDASDATGGIRPSGEPFAANSDRSVTGELVSEQTGIDLALTPLIYEGGLDVDIAGCISDYNGFDDTGFPRINSRKFSTKVRLGERDELILGGLTRESQIKAGNKPPIFGSIPIIGYLFGGENTRRDKFELVVALSVDKIDRFAAGRPASVGGADQDVILQGEGSKPVSAPKSTWGYDQFSLDKEKASYVMPGGGSAPASAPAPSTPPPPPPPPAPAK